MTKALLSIKEKIPLSRSISMKVIYLRERQGLHQSEIGATS